MTVFEQHNVIEKALPHRDMYAMYLRKSRADIELEALGEGETLTKHKVMLFNLAARHDIHPDQIVIYQEIVSGESLQDRPEALRLLEDVYARKYKGVLVVEVERLARGNTKDQGEVADAFQISDTKIITPVKVYDPNDEFDREYGYALAAARCAEKIAAKRCNRAYSKVDEAKAQANAALAHLQKMMQYEADAEAAYNIAAYNAAQIRSEKACECGENCECHCHN